MASYFSFYTVIYDKHTDPKQTSILTCASVVTPIGMQWPHVLEQWSVVSVDNDNIYAVRHVLEQWSHIATFISTYSVLFENYCKIVPAPCSTTRGLANLRYESLIACISLIASCISVLSLGCFLEQVTPRAMTWTKHCSIMFLVLLSWVPVCSHIVVSAISQILSGRASSENLCRSIESLNISSVGLLPVKISSSNMPRL